MNNLALIDSGSDSCIFPGSIATALGIALPNENIEVFAGSSNAPQTAYFENVTVHVWEFSHQPHIAFSFDLYAGFCPTFEHSGLGLLGQNGFFSRFVVSMNNQAGVFEID